MFQPNTVFVLGAGASHEVGLPLGSELKRIIAKKLDFEYDSMGSLIHNKGDRAIYQCLYNHSKQEVEDYITAAWMIRDGIMGKGSIDDFIDTHEHDKKIANCGKIAIVQSILEGERNCSFLSLKNGKINLEDLENKWYMGFFLLLAHQVRKSNLNAIFENIKVISFNYDRCLEHFLVYAIKQTFLVELEDAHDIVKSLKIFHPYGTVGPYFDNNSIEFGSKKLPSFETIILRIKTYTEQVNDRKELDDIHKAVFEANTIVYLGSAFHKNNMDFLTNKGPIKKRFFGTNQARSWSDMVIINKRIFNAAYIDTLIEVSDWRDNIFSNTCAELFNQHGMRICESE